jgi:SanA protein
MRRLPERRRTRRIALLGAAALALAVVATIAANLVVMLGSQGETVDRAADAPRAQAALVPGAYVFPDGRLSPMLADRLTVAERLYRAGKVRKILLSGDHGRADYDEVDAMKTKLLLDGIPERDVFTDHAGFDTLDTMIRARKVFDVRSALVVTQKFHMPRALWLGHQAGLTVHGVVADLHGYGSERRKSTAREWFARVKAVADVLTGASPRFLGPQIPITGDGRASRG